MTTYGGLAFPTANKMLRRHGKIRQISRCFDRAATTSWSSISLSFSEIYGIFPEFLKAVMYLPFPFFLMILKKVHYAKYPETTKTSHSTNPLITALGDYSPESLPYHIRHKTPKHRLFQRDA